MGFPDGSEVKASARNAGDPKMNNKGILSMVVNRMSPSQ